MEYQGVCQFCSQVAVPAEFESQEAADRAATLNCVCVEGRDGRNRIRQVEMAKLNVDILFGEGCQQQNASFLPQDEAVVDLFRCGVDNIDRGFIQSITIGLRSGGTGRVKISASGDFSEVRFMYDFARKRAFELLWKAGYHRICLNNQGVYGYPGKYNDGVSWSAGSIEEALQLPRRILKTAAPEDWDCLRLWRARTLLDLREQGLIGESDLLFAVQKNVDATDVREVLKICRIPVGRLVRYMDKQKQPLYVYRDYLKECTKLRYDLTDKAVLYPKNLRAAHARMSQLVKYEHNKKALQCFEEQVKSLAPAAFEKGDLMIRPAASPVELAEEGAALNHCVAGYADRMAEGKTAIFLIRRREDPETPFYTLEWKGGRVIQCRTKCNSSYELDPAVQAFVAEWIRERMSKVRIAA